MVNSLLLTSWKVFTIAGIEKKLNEIRGVESLSKLVRLINFIEGHYLVKRIRVNARYRIETIYENQFQKGIYLKQDHVEWV